HLHPGHPAAAPGIVQRKTGDARTGVPNDVYIGQHAITIMYAVTDRIGAAPLTQPHPRLRWKSESIGKTVLGRAITHYVYAGPDELTLKRMALLTAPADLVAIVDAARRGPEGSRGDAVHIMVAAAFDEPIGASIQRMGTRACVQYDANHGKPIAASSVVASCPLDRVIAELLVDPEVVDHAPAKHGGADDTGGRPFLHGTQSIKFDWLGAQDPALWNWIKVTSPANATVEDVARHPFWGDQAPSTAEQAYRIAASPPYFGIPFETARLVPQMFVHAPEDLRAKLQQDPGPRDADATKLATSALSDDAARLQAPAQAKDAPPAEQAADRCLLQLGFMNQELAPWHAND